ncbi:carboxymuconolactone decarboxylase family protein [Streptomyces chartreusis]|uniref:carboxymuconolactone decarboxylase family protein n=1 Tax=Streptomyces chartreusis TaxID=1969 RepID=UPI0036BC9513
MLERPSTEDGQWGGRLHLIDGPELSVQARALSDQLHEAAVPFAERAGFAGTTEDAKLIGLWNVQLHRPDHAEGFNRWVLADQQGSSLSPRMREIVMLAVGVVWEADWVIYSHVAAARTAGLSESMIVSLLDGRTDGEFDDDEAVAHAFADGLARRHTVSDEIYHDAVRLLGQDGVLDLTQLVSVYVATAAQLNAFRVPAPPVEPPVNATPRTRDA